MDYIRSRKTVALEELAAEFGMRTQVWAPVACCQCCLARKPVLCVWGGRVRIEVARPLCTGGNLKGAVVGGGWGADGCDG